MGVPFVFPLGRLCLFYDQEGAGGVSPKKEQCHGRIHRNRNVILSDKPSGMKQGGSIPKEQAAQRFNAWREDASRSDARARGNAKARANGKTRANAKARLDAKARKRLAKELTTLAERQRTLLRTLSKLWLERSETSNFDMTQGRINRSIRSLRQAARALERNRPPAPVNPEPFSQQGVIAAVRQSIARVSLIPQ